MNQSKRSRSHRRRYTGTGNIAQRIVDERRNLGQSQSSQRQQNVSNY